MLKVSLIIPVYNVEDYLVDCVNSILLQSYQDYEILLVDDGSQDNSGILCDELALKDSRIKVFHKKNGGSSSARNYGIDKAVGDYIIFLDSDDYWLSKDVLWNFVSFVDKCDLDLVRGEFVNVGLKENKFEVSNAYNEFLNGKILSSYDMMKSVVKGRFFTWLFLIKKSLLINLRFNESLNCLEDMEFIIKLFSRNLRCGYLPIQFYAYRQRENSIMSTPRISNLANSFALCDVFHEYAYKVEDKRLTPYYLYRGIMMYYWTLETVASDLYIDRYKELEKKLSLIALRKKVYSWIKEVPKAYFPIHLYVSPYIGVRLFRLRWWGGRILRKLKLKSLK